MESLKDFFFISILKMQLLWKYFAYVNVLFENYMAESHLNNPFSSLVKMVSYETK